MSGLVGSLFGSGESTTNVVTQTAPLTQEEKDLIALNTQLAQLQIGNITNLAPFQQELINSALAGLKTQQADDAAINAAVTPEQKAALAKQNYEYELALGPIQEQLLQQQLANSKGELTPAQQAAVTAQIKAGKADIDASVSEGIGLIADELANSRGLRLTDTPILREATLLTKDAQGLKKSLAQNLRGQALFQMPGQSAGIAQAIQSGGDFFKNFQANLRQSAQNNRMALFGQTSGTGIGLASVGFSGGPALGALNSQSLANSSQSGTGFNPAQYLSGFGNFLGGIGSLSPYKSDRRLKEDIERIGTLPNGLPLYRFRFIGRDEEHIGVMADEVLKVRPDAVSKDADGYYMVDYRKIVCH